MILTYSTPRYPSIVIQPLLEIHMIDGGTNKNGLDVGVEENSKDMDRGENDDIFLGNIVNNMTKREIDNLTNKDVDKDLFLGNSDADENIKNNKSGSNFFEDLVAFIRNNQKKITSYKKHWTADCLYPSFVDKELEFQSWFPTFLEHLHAVDLNATRKKSRKRMKQYCARYNILYILFRGTRMYLSDSKIGPYVVLFFVTFCQSLRKSHLE